ncbi:MAG TPA: hypothetical protein VFW92_01835 [Candidatus Limnocylindrales bacterium]|nr:hypothetical protein [Candidatus Limnocylindrales bacterium]
MTPGPEHEGAAGSDGGPGQSAAELRTAADASMPAEPPPAPEPTIDPGPHDLLLIVLSVGLLLRGLLGLADAWSLSSDGVRFIGLEATLSLGVGSVGWSAGWGAAAIAAGLLLLGRRALGWLVAVAACVAYVVIGIGEVAQVTGSAPGASGTAISLGVWLFFLVDLAVPAVLLALLFTVRPWFLARSRSRSVRT